MATKTISIDLEAYERLKSRKQERESFSQVIKRIIPKPFDLNEWLKTIEAAGKGLSPEFFEGVERQIALRQAPRNMRNRIDALFGHQHPARSHGKRRTKKNAGRTSRVSKAA